MSIKEKIQNLLTALTEGLYEREEPVKLALLAALAGESIFLLGPPGVGKSLIARRLKYAFGGAQSFEYLMTRFSTPEEVFGPVSIQKLKEEDRYERKTEEYMPGAHIVFLDEIWKASSSIQNALLTIINEKVYRNGAQEVKVDLRGLVTASNELPPEGENFGPLYDRLLIRYPMQGVKNTQNFLRLITATKALDEDPIPEHLKISNEEWLRWQKEIDQVEVAEEVLSALQIVRQKILDYNEKQGQKSNHIAVYDRRWKKIVRLMRSSAFLHGRSKVTLMDCFLMAHCLWNKPEQYAAVSQMVQETLRDHGYSLTLGLPALRQEIRAFAQEVDEEIKVAHTVTEEVLRPVDDEYYALQKNGEDFQGKYLKVQDFNKLKLQQAEVVNYYDEDFKLVNRLTTEKPPERHQLRVKHNAHTHKLQLETYQKEKKKYLFKKPHRLVKAYWDERYERIAAYVQEQQEKLRQYQPAELQPEAARHLFVDERLHDIIAANHQELQEELATLQLKLEKTKHHYENVD